MNEKELDALQMLDRCLSKKEVAIWFVKYADVYEVSSNNNENDKLVKTVQAKTLSAAICLLAKELFGKD